MNKHELKLLQKKYQEQNRGKLLVRTLKQSVDHGGNGTLGYVIKKGVNKGKVIG